MKDEAEEKTPQILVVDDEPFNIKAIEFLMKKKFDLSVCSVFSGMEAIEEVKKRHCLDGPNFTLIFMDLNMPVMTG